MKNARKTVLLTSLLTLLPMVVGLILWNKLPDQVPTHWNMAGEVDGWSSKAFAVFGLAGILLGCHLLVCLCIRLDPKGSNITGKFLQLSLWLTPFLSVILSALVYTTSLGNGVSPNLLIPLFLGLLFVVVGNYLPKAAPNYTVGIRVPWTLASEENWNRTHRMAGPVSVVGGVILLLCAFTGAPMLLVFAVVLVIALVPVVYSALLFFRQK